MPDARFKDLQKSMVATAYSATCIEKDGPLADEFNASQSIVLADAAAEDRYNFGEAVVKVGRCSLQLVSDFEVKTNLELDEIRLLFKSADWLVKSSMNLPFGDQRSIALDKLRQQRTVNKVTGAPSRSQLVATNTWLGKLEILARNEAKTKART